MAGSQALETELWFRPPVPSLAPSIYYSSVLQFVQQSYYSCGVTPR
jgi:hypothetical protein